MISIIAAVAQNGVIGDKNALLWHISEDLRFFKRTTSGHPVIMGRKTYESLGRPLPNRTNVVISRTPRKIEGCTVVSSLEEAIALFPKEEEIFIIGGAQIYDRTRLAVSSVCAALAVMRLSETDPSGCICQLSRRKSPPRSRQVET